MARLGSIRRRCMRRHVTTALACLFNWNLLGDGEHEVVALVDGVELDRATVMVTTLGAEFLRDVTGTCTAADFPTMAETVTLAWQQTQQNFVIVDGPAPAGSTNRAGTPGVGYLENPGPNSFQSGIGVLSGWVCEGAEVIIELNGASPSRRRMAPSGWTRWGSVWGHGQRLWPLVQLEPVGRGRA